MAGFDIHGVLERLAGRRPIFHSEADFRFALAWQIAQETSDSVRLERPFSIEGANKYLDIWLRTPGIAIELKFRTRCLSFEHNGERFSLNDMRGHTQGRCAFIEDIWRIEKIAADRLVEDRNGSSRGFAVLLTNDPLYWKVGRAGSTYKDSRLYQGRRLTGRVGCTTHAGEGATKNGLDPLVVCGSYVLDWRPYRTLPTENGKFQYLAVEIA